MNVQEKNNVLKNFSEAAVYFPKFAKAYSIAYSAIEMSINTASANAAIICGPSGAGKTTLCKQLIDQYDRNYHEESPGGVFHRKTTVYFEVPEPVTIRQLVEEMLHKVGVSTCKGSIAHLTSMLITQLGTLGVEVVFLDEIQRLCLPSADKIRMPTLGWIVSFCNRLQKPVMLAGTEECRYITQFSDAFANRYPNMIVLNFFNYEPRADSDYHRTLEKLDELMHTLRPMQSAVHLHDADIAAGLYVGTSGNLKWLRILIYRALEHCLIRDDGTALRREDFLYASCQLNSKLNLHTNNPFLLDLSQSRELIQTSKAKLAEWWLPE
ncbi:hypothetical protein D3C76_588170 [compost metagenome]